MPSGNCKGCGGMTNSTTSNWWDNVGKNGKGVATKCYVKWVNQKPVSGCTKYPKYLEGFIKAILASRWREKNES